MTELHLFCLCFGLHFGQNPKIIGLNNFAFSARYFMLPHNEMAAGLKVADKADSRMKKASAKFANYYTLRDFQHFEVLL